jgi:hypothetical protein
MNSSDATHLTGLLSKRRAAPNQDRRRVMRRRRRGGTVRDARFA